MELVETSVFTRQITVMLTDGEYRRFQFQLVANSALGSVIGGGGARVIYYWAVRKNVVLLRFAYPKSVAVNFTLKQTAQPAKFVKEEFPNENENV
ncbi:MAG: hypothetical protein ACKV2U_20460 [Bryobacteraceae bacterium]